MKTWLHEKRGKYLQKMLEMKANPQLNGSGEESGANGCPRCGLGRPVWRCMDCSDKRPLCVLCCRQTHQIDIFHRIEKWNGRYFQQGALWQVGTKIYCGHHGSPCPKSAAALSGLQDNIKDRQNPTGNVLGQVAVEFGLSETDVLQIISDALDSPIGSMSQIGRDILNASAEKAGITVLDLLQYLKAAALKNAEDDAEDLQVESDRAAADSEATNNEHAHNVEDAQAVPLEGVVEPDDAWEDEDNRPAKGNIPRFLPRPPPVDGAGNTFLTVVHTNGFHSLPVVWCCCPDHSDDRDLQLLELHLYPASYERIKTVFTFRCLDDHRFESLECKSSHYQYHNKLRRWTCSIFPDAAPNRYVELCRVGRQWRNLKYRKWFWMLTNLNGKRGEMALFCAACPQDGINLEPDWKAEQASKP